MYIWLDLETTGLNIGPDCQQKDRILEIAAIITDDQLNEVERLHIVTNEARQVVYSLLNPIVQDMHHKNGLWMESLRSNVGLDDYLARNPEQSTEGARNQLKTFIKKAEVEVKGPDGNLLYIKKPVLAGSSVHFDRQFLDYWMKDAVRPLHYRILDVSSINELALSAWPEVFNKRPGQVGVAHRAMADIETSLAVARYYRSALGALPDGTKAA